MSEIVDFKHPGPPKEPTLNDVFGDDAHFLRWIAEWRAVRAQMHKNWAEYDLATGWGTLPSAGIELDHKPLERMQELEYHLATKWKPRTMLLARQLLGMCVTILAYEDRESVLADGPVLDIIHNVISSLEFCKGEMRIGPKDE
jgi:hypothetical protein